MKCIDNLSLDRLAKVWTLNKLKQMEQTIDNLHQSSDLYRTEIVVCIDKMKDRREKKRKKNWTVFCANERAKGVL